MTMITFDRGQTKFSLRVVGIIIESGKVLLCQNEQDTRFWFMPGGRAELLESSSESIKREMQEELGVEVQVERLLWMVENFGISQGLAAHEISMHYLIRLPAGSLFQDQTAIHRFEDGGVKSICKWHDLGKLDDIVLYPEFLRAALHDIPDKPQHIICHEAHRSVKQEQRQ